MSKYIKLLICFSISLIIWYAPHPLEITSQAWHLLAIFTGTIMLILLQALPMGAATILGLTFTILTKTMKFDEAFSGYVSQVPWLILAAFFIAHGFISTGLGSRIAYRFIAVLGKSTLGLGYGLMLTDLALAPVIPSLTARAGGVVYPIVKALSEAFKSSPKDGTQRRVGAYLIMCVFQCTVVSAGMFLTAMAANPYTVTLAEKIGVTITWTNWAYAAIVPGLACLLTIPFVVYIIFPPELKATPDAIGMANKKLKDMGSMSRNETIMAIGFVFILILWIFGKKIGISAAVAALIGLCFLLCTDVLQWKELLKINESWDTFIWFGALIALASGLNKYGLTTWFGDFIAVKFGGSFKWYYAFSILLLIYFYSHYFFASSVAHVSALYLPLITVAVNLGAPPVATALAFGIASNLYGSLTHYGCGPAPILYSAGYLTLNQWWRMGFILSIYNLTIWFVIGGAWWRFINLI